MISLIPALIAALILTILIEYGVLLPIIRGDWRHLLLYVILINGFTNPFLNYLYLFEYHSLWQLELAVVMGETILIHLLTRVTWRTALIGSLCANGISVISGLILFGN